MSPRRVRYQLAISLDGFIGPLDGSLDWLAPYESIGSEILTPFMREVGGLVMGRLTYEQLLSHGPNPFGDLPTVVMTSNPTLPIGVEAVICTNGPPAALETLHSRMDDRDIWLFGGGRTASGFLDADLVDTIELTTVPVVLGAGKPLFPGAQRQRTFDLIDSRAGPAGTVTTRYARPG